MSQGNVTIPAVAPTNFRTLATSAPPDGIAPPYLLGYTGSRFLYTMAIVYDGLTDAAGYAVRARFPDYAPADAFQWLQIDRQIDQGFSEPSAHFALRLKQYLDTWRRAGTSTGLLLAIRGAVWPALPTVRTVQRNGLPNGTFYQWQTYGAGVDPFQAGQPIPQPPTYQSQHVAAGSPTPPPGTVGAWNWDGASAPFYSPWMWWRQWVIILSPGGAPFSAPTATWGPASGTQSVVVQANSTYGKVYALSGAASTQGATNFTYGANGVGTCWGWAGTNAQAKQLTALARKWKSAHVYIPAVLVAYSSAYFDPATTYGSAFLPNGQWGNWGQVQANSTYGTVYARARPSEALVGFLDGSQRDLNYSY